MMETEIKIGGSYKHDLHGYCTVVHKTYQGYWIQVWGGPSKDKLYTFKGVKSSQLKRWQ